MTYASTRMYGAMPAHATGNDNPVKVDGYVLHPSTLNENLLKAQYAVRGELYNKAVEMAAEGKDIIYTNGRCLGIRRLLPGLL